MVLKSFKLRLYPNLEQSSKLNKTLGCTRLVYNYFLDYKINLYKNIIPSRECINVYKKVLYVKFLLLGSRSL